MKTYTQKQVASILKVKPSFVRYHTENGLVAPVESLNPGTGKMRKYTGINLAEFSIIKELAFWGASLSLKKKIFEHRKEIINKLISCESVAILNDNGKISVFDEKTFPANQHGSFLVIPGLGLLEFNQYLSEDGSITN